VEGGGGGTNDTLLLYTVPTLDALGRQLQFLAQVQVVGTGKRGARVHCRSLGVTPTLDIWKCFAGCAGDILEQGVLLSVRLQDDAAFERNYLQLRTYYTDTRQVIQLLLLNYFPIILSFS